MLDAITFFVKASSLPNLSLYTSIYFCIYAVVAVNTRWRCCLDLIDLIAHSGIAGPVSRGVFYSASLNEM
jgi:hypothetical protein